MPNNDKTYHGINTFSGSLDDLPAQTRSLIERRERLLGPAYRLFYEQPIHLVRGEGVWLYDALGNAYLDAYNNVPAVGHCHPRVVDAIHRQSAQLNTHTRYLNETVLNYAERLLSHFPGELGHVIFTSTGSEANDLALRIAEFVTGGTGVIVTRTAYHGLTHALSQMSPALRADIPGNLPVWTVPPPFHHCYETGSRFANGVTQALETMRAQGIRPAALFCDTIFSSDGVFADPPGFLREAVDVVRAAGGLFVADEVQPGFGRTGDAMWGFARHGLIPDMVSLGKAMGNGQPIAGLVVRPDLIAEFGPRARYFNTFGGNPVSCAAALTTLQVIEEEGLMANALETGTYLRLGLERLAHDFSVIGDVRGVGLFVGVEIIGSGSAPDALAASSIVNGMRKRGVLISAAGAGANVLKIRPPLVFLPEHADLLLQVMREELNNF